MSFLHTPPTKLKTRKSDKPRKQPQKIKDMDLGSSVGDPNDADDESRTNISVDVTEDEASTIDHSSLPWVALYCLLTLNCLVCRLKHYFVGLLSNAKNIITDLCS